MYDRYLISPDKNKILLESKKGLIEHQPEELLKTPYIFEFAGLKENKNYLETVVEMILGDNVKNVYASKYLTYLPSSEELIKIIKDEKEENL